MFLAAAELFLLQAKTLVALHGNGDAGRTLPSSTNQHEVHAARSLIIGPCTIAFVHRIVVEQTAFVARQSLSAIGIECGAIHSTVPQAELQHVALVHILSSTIEANFQW